ncbi:MAG: copper-binding protein [Casimicrobiaceae bacterium]
MKTTTILLAVAMASTSFAALAEVGGPQDAPQAPQVNPTPSAVTEGEVRKIDKDAGKITLRHGPITNLDMPGMTMVFRVSDPAMLDGVKEGAKVRFVADRVGGALTVTAIEHVTP